MRILICGDRNWFKISYVREILSWFDPKSYTIIHGAARGADSMAGEVAEKLGYNLLVFPADWEKHHRAAGPIRNRQMLEEGKPDIVFALHSNLAESKGTKDMVKISCKVGLPVLIYA